MAARYSVTLRQRLDALGVLDHVLTDEDSFKYEWYGGGERYGFDHVAGVERTHGATHFRASYHPCGYCEGDGICIWCGRTLWD